jgi:hypothetical protein
MLVYRGQFGFLCHDITEISLKVALNTITPQLTTFHNYGKTTRIPNIPETGTLLKHGTDRNENFGNKKKII